MGLRNFADRDAYVIISRFSCGRLAVFDHYTRAQFLEDARLFQLPEDGSFTQAHLRRLRRRLMQKHHPDKGGTKEEAQRINVTYERLSCWIEAERRRRTSQTLRVVVGLLVLVVGSGGYIAACWKAASGRSRSL